MGPENMNKSDFPKDFIFGSATASYQIEGAYQQDGRGPSIWDTFSHTPGKVANGDTGDVACDHYNRYPEDVALMKDVGFGAYRLSVAWSRILPEGKGKVNPAGLDFYDRLVDSLIAKNIDPWLTLYHWDLPQALEDNGGWLNRDTAHRMADYADVLTQKLGDRVKNWITHNEPFVTAFMGYHTGQFAPGLKDQGFAASHNLLISHGLSVKVVRNNVKDGKVGITLDGPYAQPATDSAEDFAATERLHASRIGWFADPVYGRGFPKVITDLLGDKAPQLQSGDIELMGVPTDFIGINYYFRQLVREGTDMPLLNVSLVRGDGERTGFDWEVHPEGLRKLVNRYHQDYNPGAIYITENGATYPDTVEDDGSINDQDRTRYFQSHVQACLDAVQDGAPLKGYFAWSMLDNFEWASGYAKRFGITRVDFETQKRTLKRSGLWWKDFLSK